MVAITAVFLFTARNVNFNMGNSSHNKHHNEEVNRIEWEHDHMKDLTVVKDKEGKHYLEAKFTLRNANDYERWANELQKNTNDHNSEVIFDPISHSYTQSGMCGSGGVAKVEYEYFPFMLEGQISNRKNKYHEPFHEKELWYLLHSLSEIGRIFHSKQKKVGDLCPKNVFLSEEGNISISNQYSWPGAVTNYHKTFHNNEITYIAPEQIDEIEIKRPEPITDLTKAQSFSAGLTMLDVALLECSEKIYERKHIQINVEMLNGMKENLKNTRYYSDTIKFVMLNLLEEEPNKRMSLSALNQWLRPHAEHIINMETFQPVQNVPNELIQTVKCNPIPHRNLSEIPSIVQRNDEVVQPPDHLEGRRQSRTLGQTSSQNPTNFENINATAHFPRVNLMNGPNPSSQNFIPTKDRSSFSNPPDGTYTFQRLYSPDMRPVSMVRRDQPFEEKRGNSIKPGDPDYERVSQMMRSRFSSPPGQSYRPQSNYYPPNVFPENAQPVFRSSFYNNHQNHIHSVPSPRQAGSPVSHERFQRKSNTQPVIRENIPQAIINEFKPRTDPEIGRKRSEEQRQDPEGNFKTKYEHTYERRTEQKISQKRTESTYRGEGERLTAIDKIQEKIRNSRMNFPSY